MIAPSFLSGEAGDAAKAIAAAIEGVESELQRVLRSQVRLVEQVSLHTLNAGGKRLRPALVTLCAAATGLPFDQGRARKLGACMELIHMATLIHDDVIDNAPTRRGVATASAVFGNTPAILSGDVLLAKAMAILADDGDLEIIRQVSGVVVELAEGEVRELEVRGDFELSEADHREILRMKTATFIQCCCELGARIAAAPENVREALGGFGHEIGMAFQLADDLLDYRGGKETGKQRAGDFTEGCATLPLILLRDHLTESELSFVATKFGEHSTDEELDLICAWMEERGAFASAQASAEHHIDGALARLDDLPASSHVTLLREVAGFVVKRKS
ncbi:MAG TPA: polyprenyl synthetase family protein [Fimbriimonadaceae bacterium]|nr:polyprenyl synthetase family protein [Fimbriimonadaceae bacterium]